MSRTETEDSKTDRRKSGFGSFLRMIFHRSQSTSAATTPSSSSPKFKKKRSGTVSGAGKNRRGKNRKEEKVSFGIEETETLKHFQKPKPPANRRRPRSSHPAMKAKERRENQEEKTVMSELEESVAARSLSQGHLASLAEVEEEEKDEDKVDSKMSKSVPNLRVERGEEEENEESSEDDKAGSEQKVNGDGDGEETQQQQQIRPFWHLLKKKEQICDRAEEGEDEKSDKNDEEEEVEIRCRKQIKSHRSESLGLGVVNSYKELIKAAHKSTPPLITN